MTRNVMVGVSIATLFAVGLHASPWLVGVCAGLQIRIAVGKAELGDYMAGLPWAAGAILCLLAVYAR